MAQFFEPSTDTDANFANSVSGQTNSFFLPKIYSKKVLNFFRKASVVEAITNTCLLYTSPSPRDRQKSRMPSSA